VGTASGPGFLAAVISNVFTNANRSSVLSPTSTPLFPPPEGGIFDSSSAVGGAKLSDWTTITEHEMPGPNSSLLSVS